MDFFVEDDGFDALSRSQGVCSSILRRTSGRHDHGPRVTVLRDISGQQADLVAVDRAQIAVLGSRAP